ncbi:ABC transporter substrate-binding protein [Ammonifex thiophilus]|uniref:ABC transporter substrate-binding protein n=1 Tax=Ammonifex thiophilus TaxID=444093 RepID=A0A3D8P4E9_9THEO|nr:ABC transporter substrate-binding protein [Ammonifex thiophilus]RDV82541.1 ABC transporter substrate-binding protein [Ammonifex thiophilus]
MSGSKFLVAKVVLGIFLAALLLAGCGSGTKETGPQKIPVKERLVTASGQVEEREVLIPSPPSRVVVLGGYAAEIIQALGAESRVVGIDEHTKTKVLWPEYVTKLPSVGPSNTPSVEGILALKPDLVIEGFLEPKIREQLVTAGIPVLKIYGYKTELLGEEIRTLGKVFKAEKRADEYASFIERQWNEVKKRVAGLPAAQKPKVYWESSLGNWKTHGKGSGAHPLIEWAGGVNLAAELGTSYPTVTPEWVAAKNPDVIIKYVGAPTMGWKGDSKKLEEIRQEIMNRPALKNTNAVKNGRVYLISDKITCAPQGAVGIYYLAKWFHPELFKDIDPGILHRDMLKRFYGEELKGIWVYPQE